MHFLMLTLSNCPLTIPFQLCYILHKCSRVAENGKPKMLEVYTVEELAKEIGVSQRTLYSYLSQGLLPEGRRVGRQVVYANLHLRYGLLARALVEGGMGIDAVGRVLSRLSTNQVQTFASPLAALVEARNGLGEELAKAIHQLSPASTDLDLQDMRLEDPVALQARIGALENEHQRLGHQLETAFTEVRERVLEDAAGKLSYTSNSDQTGLEGLRADVQALNATMHDLALILAAQFIRDESAQSAARAAAKRLRDFSDKSGVLE